ncbi:MAG: iron ABC transporter permease [Synergistaceae bacterium]|jgi:iron(III) transport system permease protein|nr:iron ABC transporter permease [Synergistaceae bacterium]
MFTRRRVYSFVLAVALVALAEGWIFSNVRGEFRSIMSASRMRSVAVTMGAFPRRAEVAEIFAWLERVNRQDAQYRIAWIDGIPAAGEALPAAGDADLVRLYRDNASDPEFVKGFDNVAYEETYRGAEDRDVGGALRALIFAPAVDSPKGEGVLLFAFDLAEQRSFERLLVVLLGVVFCVAVLVLWQIQFSRDPIVGFAITGLFLMSLIFVAYPLFESVRLSFVQDGKLTLQIWRSILTSRGYQAALKGSIRLGFWTATFSTLTGFLFAFVCSRTSVRFRPFIAAMGTLPVISPPFSLTLSVILLLGNNGLLTRLLGITRFSIYGLHGLVLVQTMGMFPIAFLTLSGVLDGIDSTFEDAALNLSAGRWKTFTSITLPLVFPGLLSAWLLVFTNSLADFANPLILSGNFRVLSLESYLEVTGMNRLGHGAALSLLLLMPTLSAFLAQRFWVGRRSYVTVTGKPTGRITELTTPAVRFALLSLICLVVVFLLSLYGTIVAGCFVKNWGIDYSFSLANIGEALTRGRDALFDTVTLAAVATPLAGVVAMIAAMVIVRRTFHGKRLLEMLIMTPFALPGTLVGISYILAFNKPPLILVGTAAIIVINYAIRELPVGVEGGVASLRQIDPAIEEAATDLGADSATVFRTIVLPLVRPAFLSSLSYTFVRSMTAVSAVIFLISARWYHLTVLIYNFSENLRFGLASVLSTVLIVIVFGVFGLMRLLIRKNENLVRSIGA